MPLFPESSVASAEGFPARLAILDKTTPLPINEAVLPLLLLFCVLLLYPYKSTVRNAVALPVIVALYVRLSLLYSSSHWGFAFCVGAYSYYGALQAFNLLVVKDVGRDGDVKWFVGETKITNGADIDSNGSANHGHGNSNGTLHVANGGERTNGFSKGALDSGKFKANGASHVGNGAVNGAANGGSHRETPDKAWLGYPAISTYPLLQRIRFTGSLIFSSRGVGWKFQVRQIALPPSADAGLFSFLLTHFVNLLITYTILEVFKYNAVIDPYFSTPACWRTPFHHPGFSPEVWRTRCLPTYILPASPTTAFIYHNVVRKHLTLLTIYAILSHLFSIAALMFTVLFPLTKPSGWAPLFGPLTAATSLRGFWTQFWHSIFKKYFSYPGEWMAFKVLGLDRKSVYAQIVFIWAAFMNSAALHGVGCYTQSGRGWATSGFFLLQPLGFLGEALLLAILKARGVDTKSVLGKTLTTTWMMAYLLWSCDMFFYDLLWGGVAATEPVAWSFRCWLAGEEAWRWGSPAEWVRWDPEGGFGGWGLRL